MIKTTIFLLIKVLGLVCVLVTSMLVGLHTLHAGHDIKPLNLSYITCLRHTLHLRAVRLITPFHYQTLPFVCLPLVSSIFLTFRFFHINKQISNMGIMTDPAMTIFLWTLS